MYLSIVGKTVKRPMKDVKFHTVLFAQNYLEPMIFSKNN
jgi:hypothetical protein